MKLLNIRQLILVYYYITSWSQCLGYLMLMSQNSDTYQQHIDKPWNYYSNNNDEANIPSDEQYYDETNNAVYNDDNRPTPYDYSVDEADAGNNYAEYEEAGTYYPTDDYHGNHYDDHSQYYAPIEYDDYYYYYNDQTNQDDNIHYDEYDPRESSGGILMHHYHQSNHHHMERRHPYDGRQYNGYHEDDVEQNYYGNEGDYDHHDDQYNYHYNNPNYNNNNYYYDDDDGYDNGDYSNYDVNDNDNIEDYGNFRDYSHQPIASYKHQKYIPHRLYNLKDYFPIDEKLYIFYPKDLKSQYYTVRTMEPSRYGQFHRYFEGELASKSVHGRFKEVYPMVYGEYTHFNHKIHDNNYNNNNHHHRHNYDYNQRQNHHKLMGETSSFPTINHHHHHYPPNWHKHLPDEKFNQYENKEEIFNEIFGFGNSMKATDYEETISYHHTGQQDPKGKIRNYSNYDIYGRMKRSSKSELGGRFEKKYHTVIDTDKRKNRHTVSYIPLNDKSKYHRNHANQRRYSNAYHK